MENHKKQEEPMELVFLTALGVGGATVLGSIIGFAFKHISHRFSDLVLAFAAGSCCRQRCWV